MGSKAILGKEATSVAKDKQTKRKKGENQTNKPEKQYKTKQKKINKIKAWWEEKTLSREILKSKIIKNMFKPIFTASSSLHSKKMEKDKVAKFVNFEIPLYHPANNLEFEWAYKWLFACTTNCFELISCCINIIHIEERSTIVAI